MLRDPLDEPEFYCVDVAGFGSNLNLNAPLPIHSGLHAGAAAYGCSIGHASKRDPNSIS